MARPGDSKSQNAQEIIIPTFTNWSRVGSVTSILAELEDGIFYDAALLVDQFMRDDRFRAVWDIAIQAVLGMPRHFESADHSAAKRSDKISDEQQKLWPKMAPTPELIELCMWGFCVGAGVAQKTWVRSKDTWVPQLKTWHAGALRFDLPSDRYMLRTQDQGEIPILPDDPNWQLFTPFGYKYGRLRSYLVSAAMLVLERQWAHRDRARHSEKHGQPWTQLIVPAEADQRDKQIAARAVATLGSETTSVTPQGVEGNRYDWKIFEPTKTSSEVFGGTLEDIGNCLAILFLGQQMSTTGSTGLGSDKNPGDTVRRDKMRFYASAISEMSHDGFLADHAEYNYGDRDLASMLVIEVDPPDDAAQVATADLATANTLNSFKLAGAPIDQRKYLEARGYGDYLMTEEEHAAQKQQAMEDAQQMAVATAPAEDDKAETADEPEEK